MKKDKPVLGNLDLIFTRFFERKECMSSLKRKDRFGKRITDGRKLRMDEVIVKDNVAHYYLWGSLISKWDGKTLWFDNGDLLLNATSYRLSNIFWTIYRKMEVEESNTPGYYYNSFNLRFQSKGFSIKPAWSAILSYPLELDMVNMEFVNTDFKAGLLGKFLRARENAGSILEAIRWLDGEITEEDEKKIKTKKLKLMMDGFKLEE